MCSHSMCVSSNVAPHCAHLDAYTCLRRSLECFPVVSVACINMHIFWYVLPGDKKMRVILS